MAGEDGLAAWSAEPVSPASLAVLAGQLSGPGRAA
jgi:hypothetical protein